MSGRDTSVWAADRDAVYHRTRRALWFRTPSPEIAEWVAGRLNVAEHEYMNGPDDTPDVPDIREGERAAIAGTVTELLEAIAAEQPRFDWTADDTADAIDRLTKLVLPSPEVAG